MLCIKRAIILLFFFFIVCNALSSSSSESNLTSEAVENKHFGKEKQLVIKNGYGNKVVKLSREVEPKLKELNGLNEVLHLGINNQSKKANKGSGSNLLRPRSKKGGASSLSLKTSCTSIALKTLALGLLFSVFV